MEHINVLINTEDQELFSFVSNNLTDIEREQICNIFKNLPRNEGEAPVLSLQSGSEHLQQQMFDQLSKDVNKFVSTPHNMKTKFGLSHLVEPTKQHNPSLFEAWLYVPISECWYLVIDCTN
jgi:hypothetical protein